MTITVSYSEVFSKLEGFGIRRIQKNDRDLWVSPLHGRAIQFVVIDGNVPTLSLVKGLEELGISWAEFEDGQ